MLQAFSTDSDAWFCHMPSLGLARLLHHLFLWFLHSLWWLLLVWYGHILISLGWSQPGPYAPKSLYGPSAGLQVSWWVFCSWCSGVLLVCSSWCPSGLSFYRSDTSNPVQTLLFRLPCITVCCWRLWSGHGLCQRWFCSFGQLGCVYHWVFSTAYIGIHPFQSQSYFLTGGALLLLALLLFLYSSWFVLVLQAADSPGLCLELGSVGLQSCLGPGFSDPVTYGLYIQLTRCP